MSGPRSRPRPPTELDSPNESGEPARERVDVKKEVARALIDAMKAGETPWQKPWNARSMLPENVASARAYQGVNRLLLALSPAARGGDNRWATYRQAQERSWQVRKGEKGTGIVKVVEFDWAPSDGENAARAGDPAGSGVVGAAGDGEPRRKAMSLRRYVVSNASQMDGPEPVEPESLLAFDPVERAENVMRAMRERTGLTIKIGGSEACYVPSLDEVRLPSKSTFAASGAYGFYSVAMHELGYSTLAPHRMDRRDAIAKRWGDSAYALEELRAEICAAMMAASTGVPMCQDAAHVARHAAYLSHWIKAIEADRWRSSRRPRTLIRWRTTCWAWSANWSGWRCTESGLLTMTPQAAARSNKGQAASRSRRVTCAAIIPWH